MSPKLNWSAKDGRFKSAVPMTAMTFGNLLRSYAPDGKKSSVLVVNERRIEITVNGRTTVIEGIAP